MNEPEVLDAVDSTAVAEYNPVAAGLADLRKRFAGVQFDVTTKAGHKAARAARSELVGLRTSLEAKRVELKAPILERSRLIDAEAKRITSAIYALENPIDDQIRAEEKRLAAAVAEAERIEAEKARKRAAAVAEQRKIIIELQLIPSKAVGKSAKAIGEMLEILDATELEFMAEWEPDLLPEATAADAEARAVLARLHAAAIAAEAEQARLKAEAEALAAERARIAAEQAAAAKIEEQRLAAIRAQQEAELAEQRRAADAERQRLAAEQAEGIRRAQEKEAAARADRERIERAAREEREAKMRAQQAEIERQRAELAERQRIADEAAAAERAAAAAKAAEERRIAEEQAAERRTREVEAARAREEYLVRVAAAGAMGLELARMILAHLYDDDGAPLMADIEILAKQIISEVGPEPQGEPAA